MAPKISAKKKPRQNDDRALNPIGHMPTSGLSFEEKVRYQTFQANLLSLISHELRTPLMGILNALSLLDTDDVDPEEASASELLSMARRNAQRLHHTLSSLLDLAAVESGTFHARLKEVDLFRIVEGALANVRAEMREQNLKFKLEEKVGITKRVPVLADPQKLTRAVELCFYSLTPRAEPEKPIQIEISSFHVQIGFEIQESKRAEWKEAWQQARIGFEGGVVSPASAFADVLKSKSEFLTRSEEGLGSELLIIHEIMRLHGGSFEATIEPKQKNKKDHISFRLELPELSSYEGIKSVLTSRIFSSSTGLGNVALALISVPKDEETQAFRIKIRKCLFRSSDAVYALPEDQQVAIIMDDCKKEDAPHLLARIEKKLGRSIKAGIVSCPDEGSDPEILLQTAKERLP